MKQRSALCVGTFGFAFAVIIGLCGPAQCHMGDMALLIQPSPAQGGVVEPSPGVYHFAPNTDVVLTATAKPGYNFLHWLGDVSDPTANRTVARVDKPKIIIAVFEQVPYSTSVGGGTVGRTFEPQGYEGSLDSRAPSNTHSSGSGGYSGGGGDDGGGEEGDTPPVPEPATVILLGLGGLMALSRRVRKR